MTRQAATLRRYVGAVGLSIAFLGATVAGFCALVDPYGIVGMPGVAGWTRDKPAAALRPRLSKPYRVEQVHPATLLIGNSTLNVGIDADSPAWPASAQPVYNFGIDGASFDIQRVFLLHALSRARPHLVIFLVSFEDSIVPQDGWQAMEKDKDAYLMRVRVLPNGQDNPEYAIGRFKDLVFATLSLDAVADSFRTLIHQGDPDLDYQTLNGFDNRNRFKTWAASKGSESLVRATFQMRVDGYQGWRLHPVDRVQVLGTMITAARDAGADVAVAVQPIYVAGLELRKVAGVSESADAWLKSLVSVVESAAAATGGSEHVALWYFGGLNGFNQERLPHPGDTTHPLRWFYEAIHFQPELGAAMVTKMLTGTGPADFGQRLSSANVAEVIARTRVAMDSWERAHPDEVAGIAALARTVRAALCRRTLECRNVAEAGMDQ